MVPSNFTEEPFELSIEEWIGNGAGCTNHTA